MNRWVAPVVLGISLFFSALVAWSEEQTEGFSVDVFRAAAIKTTGMKAIRYELNKNDEADVIPSLYEIAKYGHVDAQLLLADLLSELSGHKNALQATEWYIAAFRKGQGRVRALGTLARFSARYEWLLLENEPFFSDALGKFDHIRNPENVVAVLETYMAYPSLVDVNNVPKLLSLHRQSCTENCNGDLYQAFFLSQQGDLEKAEALYLKAALYSSRAIRVYFNFLDGFDDKSERFKRFSQSLKPHVHEMSAEVLFSVGSRLQGISQEYDRDVIFWLDASIEKGWLAAQINKATYMMSQPDYFSYSETEDVIFSVYEHDLIRGKLLRASLLIVREWKRLNPHEAYSILQELHEQGHIEATLGLGDLYSMGGLDEVDQYKAIELYSIASKKGSAASFQKIAGIYRSGRSICNDKVKSYSFSKMADYYGEESAEPFIKTLAEDMSPEELALAESFFSQLLKDYPPSEFE